MSDQAAARTRDGTFDDDRDLTEWHDTETPSDYQHDIVTATTAIEIMAKRFHCSQTYLSNQKDQLHRSKTGPKETNNQQLNNHSSAYSTQDIGSRYQNHRANGLGGDENWRSEAVHLKSLANLAALVEEKDGKDEDYLTTVFVNGSSEDKLERSQASTIQSLKR